jgi:hypothetical protein
MYLDVIKQATECTDVEAEQIEDLMRNVIFKSTLDWQTRQELMDAAKLAQQIIRYRARQDARSS